MPNKSRPNRAGNGLRQRTAIVDLLISLGGRSRVKWRELILANQRPTAQLRTARSNDAAA